MQIYRLFPHVCLRAEPWFSFAQGAFEACGMPRSGAEWLADALRNPKILALVGAERGEVRALFVAELPSTLASLPTILMAYNVGSKGLRRQLFACIARWVRQAGYEHVQMINHSAVADATYERAMRPLGTVTERHTLFTVRLREEGSEGAEVLTAGARELDAGAGAA